LSTLALPRASRGFVIGRTFLHPGFDYMVIGGGLSLIATALVLMRAGMPSRLQDLAAFTPWLLLGLNLTHFAASTVRLYTKPGAFQELRFLTMGLPLVTLAVLAVAVRFADHLGAHLMNLYLTWSPFHYAAQAYGLAVMYCYRTGLALEAHDRSLVRLACLAPFVYAFFKGPGAGIDWFVPTAVLLHPAVSLVRQGLVYSLGAAALLLPLLLALRFSLRGPAVPLISFVVILSNAVWWTVLLYEQAFAWATVFHGLQYLAITTIFHVRERSALSGNRHGPAWHAVTFYLTSLGLAYLLFNTWPYAFVAAGFGLAESTLLVVATINVHHFIVDGYIWRLRKDRNYGIVTGALEPARP
jgi:hypothetical protein